MNYSSLYKVPSFSTSPPPFHIETILADDGTLPLPAIASGNTAHGFVSVSAGTVVDESAEFEVGSDGNVSIIRSSANVVANSDTDTKVCLGTAAAQNPLIVKNRLGGTRQVLIDYWHG